MNKTIYDELIIPIECGITRSTSDRVDVEFETRPNTAS